MRRRVGFPNPLNRERAIIGLLLLAGPLSCLINPTWAVSLLWYTGQIRAGEYPFTWWTWWVGDTIGVFVVTPLVLLWSNRAEPGWPRRPLVVSLPLAALVALVVGLFVYVKYREEDRIRERFERTADRVTRSLQHRLEYAVEAMHRSLQGLADGRTGADPQRFARVAHAVVERRAGIGALEWTPRVAGAGRAAFEAAGRRDYGASFGIVERDANGRMVPEARRPEYFPIRYLEPRADTSQLLGFDLASEARRRAALERACDTGEPVATPIMKLAEDPASRADVLIFLPVYGDANVPDNVAERRRTLRGFVAAALRVRSLTDFALEGLGAEGIDLRIQDTSLDGALAAVPALEDRPPGTAREPEEALPAAPEPAGMQQAGTFEAVGRTWAVRYTLTPQYLALNRSVLSWSVLAGGLLFTGLLGAFLLAVTGRASLVAELVKDRTAALARANAELIQENAERHRAESELRVNQEHRERVEQQLRELNESLEERVRERTAAVEKQSEELRQLNTALVRSNQDLDDFAYIIAHDLKEPLRGIGNYAAFLLEDYAGRLDDDGRSKLSTLVRLSSRMADLLDGLLKVSHLDRGELAVGPTDLNVILDEVIDSLQILLDEQAVDIRVPAPLPTIECDRVRVGEVFRNLLTNAAKYNDKPQKEVAIGFQAPERAGTPAVFHVRDNGIGIRADQHAAVFRIFKRLHPRDRFGGGAGVGLTIVKKIIERHGGRIWIESEVGVGTTFFFTLGREG